MTSSCMVFYVENGFHKVDNKLLFYSGTASPSSPVAKMTSLGSLGAMQNTTAVSQGPTPTQSTVVTSGNLPQTQSTMAVSHVLPLTQSTVVASQGLSQTQSTVVVSHGLTRAPTQNTKDALEPSYVNVGKDNRREPNNEIRATASVPDFTQAKLLITLGILLSYLVSWC